MYYTDIDKRHGRPIISCGQSRPQIWAGYNHIRLDQASARSKFEQLQSIISNPCLRSNFWPLHYGKYFTPQKKHQQTHLFQRIKFLIEFLLRRRKARSWCRFQRKLFSPAEFSHRAIILFNSQQYWNEK